MSHPRKIVLAYSGGLDTSVILKWLQNETGAEIVTFTADLGQGTEVETARAKAIAAGVKPENVFVEDLREQLVRDFAMPAFRANACYDGYYLMGTPIARPLVASRQIEIARMTGADAVAHGATGKGNDQLRFELAYYALEPGIRVVAPWREWSLGGRADLIAYADAHGVPVAKDKRGAAPYSSDANLLHISAEGNDLEDPWLAPSDDVFTRTASLREAPDSAETITISFERGDPVAIDGRPMSPVEFLETLNQLGGRHGVGRLDIVDTRYVGIKSRGVFEAPGATIWQVAHRAIESITLDRGEAHLKDELMPRYAALIYNGFWFAPERAMLQALIDKSQERATGDVRVRLHKGNVIVEGRRSPFSLYSREHVTFETDAVYAPADASGFIAINALRLRLLANVRGASR
jgi:argininosuccinate synthase